VSGTGSCVSCGAPLTPATSFLSETGVLCAACFGRWEVEQRARESAVRVEHARQLDRASRLAYLHGINWGTAFILLAGWAHLPGWLATVLVAFALVTAYAMAFRSQLAFRAAMALDTLGGLVVLLVSVVCLDGGRLLILSFPVAVGVWLGRLTWLTRATFTPPPRF
jgi:hypothetical protein